MSNRAVFLSCIVLMGAGSSSSLIPSLHSTASAAPAPIAQIRKSVARIHCTAESPNYRIPWLPGQPDGGSGTGWMVAGNRLMTNAHVVSNAKFITVERENDPKRYVAKVAHVAHDCDLALLTVADASFFEGAVPLAIGGIPEIESTVSVFGFPIGGERLSVTRGVVSRVDFRTYSHSVMDQHLTIQIDAAINPGNSGGPVLQDGKVVGVAFQGYSGDVAQNVGYMIPTPVIQHFLKDVEDGHYDRYMDLAINFFNLQNAAYRKALGLPNDDIGVVVTSISAASPAHGIVHEGDVLLGIDGLPIASDGMVELEGERVLMAEVSERKFLGDTVKLDVQRKGEKIALEVKFLHAWPFTMQGNQYETSPAYVTFGGLLFQPLNRNVAAAYSFQSPRVNYWFDFFITRELYKDRPEVVVLTAILPDPLNTYLGEYREGIVDKVNGEKIQSLKALSEAFEKPSEFYVIEFSGFGRPAVLERAAVAAARKRIAMRYQITDEHNIVDPPSFGAPKHAIR